ncbi:hypothetical protein HIM_10698 [Hirsutella minnesotensis 3608]|uniref:Integrase catalytic domain-containing protein n=1 Tax=Hirsutella minnesotensis 3608 TaxID=1043627 RepID=A0A0F7ZRN3_9HYPO|nr:hypothetical protein HIM_10698 [Hirsutella minnesotensis 3608]
MTSTSSAPSADAQLDDLNERMQGLAIQKSAYSQVDIALWGQDIGPDEKDEIAVTTYTARFMSNAQFEHLQSYDILDYFQEHFEGWTISTWKCVPDDYKRALRNLLRRRGIYTGRQKGRFATQFLYLQTVDKPPNWPEEEFMAMEFDERTAAHRRKMAVVGSNAPTNPLSPQPPSPTTTSEQPVINVAPSQSPPPAPTTPVPTTHDALIPTSLTAHPTSYRFQHPELVQPVHTPRPEPPSEPMSIEAYTKLPPDDIPNATVDGDTQQKFMKLWDKDKNYTGEPYNLLDDKIRIFMSICYNIQVKPSQFHALFPRILTGRAQTFYIDKIKWTTTFRKAYDSIKQHFDTDVNHVHYYTDWTTTTFYKLRTENATKSLHDVLQLLFDKLQLCQRALGKDYAGDIPLRTTLINACRGVPELEYALFKPAEKIETLFADLRSSVETHLARRTNLKFTQSPDGSFDQTDPNNQYYLDRRYNNNRVRGRYGYSGQRPNRGYGQGYNRGSYRPQSRGNYTPSHTNRNWTKKCFVCGQEGCWSTKHSAEERQRARDQYVAHYHFTGVQPPDFATYVIDYEGHELDVLDDDNDIWEENDDDIDNHPEQWQASQMLCQQAFNHLITGEDAYRTDQNTVPASQFVIEDRYSKDKFQGIMIDTGAAKVSTAGHSQYIALQREDPSVALDRSTSGQATIKFGNGEAIHSVGSIALKTPAGRITFHILQTPTPFLLSLADMDRLGVYFNNITDTLNCTNHCTNRQISMPVTRKWGHPWFFLSKAEDSIAFLTETEIRTLHRRFGHPAVPRLYHLLKQAGHSDVSISTLETISKFCHHCQMHSQAPRRFKFTLKDDQEFNYKIIVDVMYLGSPQRPVLHVVDAATAFQGARFLPSMSAKDTWETLRTLWIDTYLGPPDTIRHDAGTNFASMEFRQEAKLMGIKCSQVPVETHWSIGKVERYHAPLRRAYHILNAELSNVTSAEAVLQMAVKAVNDTAGPDGIVPTLLVFGAYPRLTADSPPSASTLKRSAAMQKAMKTLRQLSAERQVKDALRTRNGPSTADVLSLPLQSEVRVWREKDGWQGPFKLASIDGHNVTIDTINGPQFFRSTHVQPYLRDDSTIPQVPAPAQEEETPARPDPPAPRKRGRPPSVANKPTDSDRPLRSVGLGQS